MVLFERGDLVHQAPGFGLVLARLGLADVLGRGVAAGLRLLQLLNRPAALLVQAQDLIQQIAWRFEAAVVKPRNEGVLVVAESI